MPASRLQPAWHRGLDAESGSGGSAAAPPVRPPAPVPHTHPGVEVRPRRPAASFPLPLVSPLPGVPAAGAQPRTCPPRSHARGCPSSPLAGVGSTYSPKLWKAPPVRSPAPQNERTGKPASPLPMSRLRVSAGSSHGQLTLLGTGGIEVHPQGPRPGACPRRTHLCCALYGSGRITRVTPEVSLGFPTGWFEDPGGSHAARWGWTFPGAHDTLDAGCPRPKPALRPGSEATAPVGEEKTQPNTQPLPRAPPLSDGSRGRPWAKCGSGRGGPPGPSSPPRIFPPSRRPGTHQGPGDTPYYLKTTSAPSVQTS